MRTLRLALLFCAFAAANAVAQPSGIDFATPGGPDRTCPKYRGLDPAKLRGDADCAAFAICNTIDLVREASSRFRSYQSQGERNDNALVSDLRNRLERIKVDRVDAYWAAAYLQFAESLLNTVLSYEVDLSQGFQVRLQDAGRITKVAYQNLLGGLRASALLRQSLPKETDDDDEWIPNPKQTRTSFPLLLDAQTFATWGELLGNVEKLFRGQTLLGGTVESQEFRNVRDLSGGVCPPGQGIDVQSLFTDPIREPMAPDVLKSRCAAPTATRPMTGLGAMIAASLKRNAGRTPDSFSGEWMILRHFYWVN